MFGSIRKCGSAKPDLAIPVQQFSALFVVGLDIDMLNHVKSERYGCKMMYSKWSRLLLLSLMHLDTVVLLLHRIVIG